MNSDGIKEKNPNAIQNEKDTGKSIASRASQLARGEGLVVSPKYEIKDLVSFIESIYTGKFKRKKLTKKEITSIVLSATPSMKSIDSLFPLVKADCSLQRTKIALSIALLTESNLRARIGNFLNNIVSQHPIFQQMTITDRLFDFHDYSRQKSVINELLKIDFSGLFNEKNKISKKTYADYKENALHCILLIFAINGVDAKRIIEIMHMYIKANGVKKIISVNEKMMCIILSKEPLNVLYEYEIMLYDNLRLASELNSKNDILNEMERDIAILKGTIGNLKEQVNEKDVNIESYIRKIKENKELLEQSEVVHCDSMVKIKSRILHRLKSEVRLLENGLIALQRNPPKVDITIDHIERTISGLKTEIENLC